jgi:hypothetical protein
MGLADRSPDSGVAFDSAGRWWMETAARRRPAPGVELAVIVGLAVS